MCWRFSLTLQCTAQTFVMDNDESALNPWLICLILPELPLWELLMLLWSLFSSLVFSNVVCCYTHAALISLWMLVSLDEFSVSPLAGLFADVLEVPSDPLKWTAQCFHWIMMRALWILALYGLCCFQILLNEVFSSQGSVLLTAAAIDLSTCSCCLLLPTECWFLSDWDFVSDFCPFEF